MTDVPHVLLTNDDGIEAVGLRAVLDALDGVADVTVVAPAEARDGASRSDTRGFGVSEHDLGYSVDGTPVDAVHFARTVLEPEFDAVVSGCNHGPTFGAHRLGRSGTVGAAIEAGFLGIPAVACSLYDPEVGQREFDVDDFAPVESVVRRLLAILPRLPDAVDYLNVNVPAIDDPTLRVTAPVHDFDVEIERHTDGYHARDTFYDPLAESAAATADPAETDRRAAADGEVSVSPLSVGQAAVSPDAVREALSSDEDWA